MLFDADLLPQILPSEDLQRFAVHVDYPPIGISHAARDGLKAFIVDILQLQQFDIVRILQSFDLRDDVVPLLRQSLDALLNLQLQRN